MKGCMKRSDYFLTHCGIPYNTMFIIDFDDTLFDTHAFKHARLRALLVAGVTEKDYHETYVEAQKKNDLFSYSNERHAELLAFRGYPKDRILRVLEETTGERLREFLFPDTVTFIRKLKETGRSLILLSLGEASFQELKVKGSGIHEYFDRVFMVQDSKEHIIQELSGVGEKSAQGGSALGGEDEIWFINDKVGESKLIQTRFPKLHIVLKKSESIAEEEYKKSKVSYFQTLTEIYEYVEQKIG